LTYNFVIILKNF